MPVRSLGVVRRRLPLLVMVSLPLALGACDASAHDESLLGYAITGVAVLTVALIVGCIVLGIGGLAYCAGAATLALNVFRPTPRTRAAGVVVGAVDVGLAMLAASVLAWLAMHGGADDGTTHVSLDGFRGLLPVVGLGGLGLANVVMALAPRKLGGAALPSA